MCGIVAATSKHRNVVPLLVQGLKRLEYRGYDSCGVAVWNDGLKRVRSVSRESELSEQIEKVRPLTGKILTAVVSVILVISMGISSFALLRQENRLKGVPPKNELEVLADKYYNDEYLKKVYPNMILKVQEGQDSSLQTGGSKE